MKSILSFLVLGVLSLQANALELSVINCKVSKIVDSNIFEESLSKEEYPEVYLNLVDGQYELELGANSYSQADGDKFTNLSPLGGDIIYRIDPSNTEAEPIILKVKKNTPQTKSFAGVKKSKRAGWVYVIQKNEEGVESLLRLANLKCK